MRAATAAVAAVLLAGLASCSHDEPAAAPPPSTTTSTPSPTPKPTPKPAPKPRPAPPVHPLTGAPGKGVGPVLAVKIDNTGPGKPQFGLEAADVVYMEEVEGGQTRLVAVYNSRYPGKVGPVRSVRNTDPELLSAYGRAGLVFSGGAGGPLATLHRSRLQDLRGAGVYSRDGSRHAPYNLVANLARLAVRSPAVARPVDVGFRWSLGYKALATARHALRMSTTVGQVGVSFGYDVRSRRWVLKGPGGAGQRTANGAPVASPNVIVQLCPVSVDRTDVDVNGVPSAYTHTVGRGKALVFRDGRVLQGTWIRSRPGGITRYVDGAGKDILLRPGGAWVLLARAGSAVQFS